MSKSLLTLQLKNQIHDNYIPYELIYKFSNSYNLNQYSFGIKRLKNIIFEYINLNRSQRILFINYIHDLKEKYKINRWLIYKKFKINNIKDNTSKRFFKAKYGKRTYKKFYIDSSKKYIRNLNFFIKKYKARLGWYKYYHYLRLLKRTNLKHYQNKNKNFKTKFKKRCISEQQYYNQVWNITRKQNLKSLKFYKLSKKHLFSLDHKISINYGFTHNISPEIIGSLENLQYIPIKLNSSKNKKCFSYIRYSNKNFNLDSKYFLELENLQKAA